MAGKPELHSVWEDNTGARLIVTALHDDEPDFWLAVAVPYAERFDPSGPALELDPDEWAELADTEGLKQIGVEPGEYPI